MICSTRCRWDEGASVAGQIHGGVIAPLLNPTRMGVMFVLGE